MKLSGGNTKKHQHWWVIVPNGDSRLPDKHCRCGALKFWNGKKWVIRKDKPMSDCRKTIDKLEAERIISEAGEMPMSGLSTQEMLDILERLTGVKYDAITDGVDTVSAAAE